MNPDCEYCGFKDAANKAHECSKEDMKKMTDALYERIRNLREAVAVLQKQKDETFELAVEIGKLNEDLKANHHPEDCPNPRQLERAVVKDLATWSRKWPKEMVHNTQLMDKCNEELYAIEERAKALDSYEAGGVKP